jgi:hypothetical protein
MSLYTLYCKADPLPHHSSTNRPVFLLPPPLNRPGRTTVVLFAQRRYLIEPSSPVRSSRSLASDTGVDRRVLFDNVSMERVLESLSVRPSPRSSEVLQVLTLSYLSRWVSRSPSLRFDRFSRRSISAILPSAVQAMPLRQTTPPVRQALLKLPLIAAVRKEGQRPRVQLSSPILPTSKQTKQTPSTVPTITVVFRSDRLQGSAEREWGSSASNAASVLHFLLFTHRR